MKIKKPTLLVKESTVRANIKKMAEKARKSNVVFRPHFKTHQSADIGEWFKEEGVEQITVSSVTMAQYFVQHGWGDITIAFPYNPLEIDEINQLAKKTKLNVLIESEEALRHLLANAKSELGYFIKIDVGSRRTGLLFKQIDLIQDLADSGSEKVVFKGLLAHAGHTYGARSKKKIIELHTEALSRLNAIKEQLEGDFIISYGDTPSCSVLDSFKDVDEIRPGNFAFYDLMQVKIGSCDYEDIGVVVACPVVSTHPNRNEAVMYGGAVHFSKDSIVRSNEAAYYGEVVHLTEDGWQIHNDAIVDRLSQEHGIINGSEKFIRSLKVGDIIGVLPVHSCLTADLMPQYFTFEGNSLQKMNRTPS